MLYHSPPVIKILVMMTFVLQDAVILSIIEKKLLKALCHHIFCMCNTFTHLHLHLYDNIACVLCADKLKSDINKSKATTICFLNCKRVKCTLYASVLSYMCVVCVLCVCVCVCVGLVPRPITSQKWMDYITLESGSGS